MKNHERVMTALLSSGTEQEAARRAGLSDRQIRRYLALPDFRAEYQRRKCELIETATLRLQNGLTGAVGALTEIVSDPEAGAAARINAARAILQYCAAYTETADILPRLEALERGVKD